ncbi:MAG: transposase [Pseudomonadota bacterium]
MAQIARVVIPGYPHPVTQRGNRSRPTFFCREDYRAYVDLMSEWCTEHGVNIRAYFLMTNHVHLIAVPASSQALALGIGEAHRRYTRRINYREGWRGRLRQGCFASYVPADTHLLAAARYREMNPVRARMARDPARYSWSSASAHIAGINDDLVNVEKMTARRLRREKPGPKKKHKSKGN